MKRSTSCLEQVIKKQGAVGRSLFVLRLSFRVEAMRRSLFISRGACMVDSRATEGLGSKSEDRSDCGMKPREKEKEERQPAKSNFSPLFIPVSEYLPSMQLEDIAFQAE